MAGLEATFRSHERMLWELCFRLTGVAADADEIVQETFARALERPPSATGDRLVAWLVRVSTNLSLDVLRTRRRRGYPGSWLPSPIEIAAPGDGPAARYERLETLSFAFLLALEALAPRQRAALVLRDVLGYSARETAEVLGMSEANVRITHHRARQRIERYDRERPKAVRSLEEGTQRALRALVLCLVNQDAAGLESLLAESVRIVTDSGGKYTALHAPLIGRGRVAQFLLRVAKRRLPASRFGFATCNGLPALVVETSTTRPREAPRIVLRCELDGEGLIREIHSVLAPRKLTAVRFAV